jgi:hypothetical protein
MINTPLASTPQAEISYLSHTPHTHDVSQECIFFLQQEEAGRTGTIVITFRINKKSPVQELIDLYCSQEGIDPLDLTFLFQGKELQCSYTPCSRCWSARESPCSRCWSARIPDASASLFQLLTFPTLSGPFVPEQKEKKHGTTEMTVKRCSEKKAAQQIRYSK